jgi:hypothetical protein
MLKSVRAFLSPQIPPVFRFSILLQSSRVGMGDWIYFTSFNRMPTSKTPDFSYFVLEERTRIHSALDRSFARFGL